MVSFNVRDNSFTGPLPEAYGAWTNLFELAAWKNSFTGTLPASWSACRWMLSFVVSGNDLSGTIPPEYENWQVTEIFGASSNRLSGTVPHSFVNNFTALGHLMLSSNLLTGRLPQFGRVPMKTIDLSNNSFEGPLFEVDINPHFALNNTLTYLALDSNLLTGTIPASWCAQYVRRMEVLVLSNNRLSGTVPECVTSFDRLERLLLASNSLTGLLPSPLSPSLDMLVASSNRLSGRLPSCGSSLTELVLHENRFSGGLEALNLSGCNALITLTLHKNNLRGDASELSAARGVGMRLDVLTLNSNELDGSVPLLPVSCNNTILLNQNRFSCGLPKQNLPQTTNLVLPGNSFDGPAPRWVNGYSAFLTVQTGKGAFWCRIVIETAIFVFVFLAAVITERRVECSRGSLTTTTDPTDEPPLVSLNDQYDELGDMARQEFTAIPTLFQEIWHTQESRYLKELFQFVAWMCGGLAVLSVISCIVLLVVLGAGGFTGGSFYQCGEWTMKYLSLTMVADDRSAELAATIGLAVNAVAVGIVIAMAQRRNVQLKQDDFLVEQDEQAPPHVGREFLSHLVGVLIWILGVLCLSSVTVIYLVLLSLPPDNVLHIPQVVIEALALVVPILMSSVNTALLPAWTRFAFQKAGASLSPSLVAIMIACARLVTTIVIPVVAVVIFDDGCYQNWRNLWSTCQRRDDGAFDANLTVKASYEAKVANVAALLKKIANSDEYTNDNLFYHERDITFTLMSNEEVCATQLHSSGVCVRTILWKLLPIYVLKVLYCAFLQPALLIFMAACAWARPIAPLLVEVATEPDGNQVIVLDEEFLAIFLWVELAIVFGAFYPALTVLVAISLLSNTLALFVLSAARDCGMRVRIRTAAGTQALPFYLIYFSFPCFAVLTWSFVHYNALAGEGLVIATLSVTYALLIVDRVLLVCKAKRNQRQAAAPSMLPVGDESDLLCGDESDGAIRRGSDEDQPDHGR